MTKHLAGHFLITRARRWWRFACSQATFIHRMETFLAFATRWTAVISIRGRWSVGIWVQRVNAYEKQEAPTSSYALAE